MNTITDVHIHTIFSINMDINGGVVMRAWKTNLLVAVLCFTSFFFNILYV